MRIDEVITEDSEFNKAWQVWMQTASKGLNYTGSELQLIKRQAQTAASLGADDMDAISSAAGNVRAQRELPKKPAPKVAPTSQKPAPIIAPTPQKPAPNSRGAQIGNQNAYKGGPKQTGNAVTRAVSKTVSKGKDTAKKYGGINQGAQRRNRKLNSL